VDAEVNVVTNAAGEVTTWYDARSRTPTSAGPRPHSERMPFGIEDYAFLIISGLYLEKLSR
jgi:hypothetical protein